MKVDQTEKLKEDPSSMKRSEMLLVPLLILECGRQGEALGWGV